jgi:hypothetical protein
VYAYGDTLELKGLTLGKAGNFYKKEFPLDFFCGNVIFLLYEIYE